MSQTYTQEDYNKFEQNGDKNLFEEIIDKMILDEVAGMNESFRNAIFSLPLAQKRMSILSLLDKDRNLFMKIKSFISSEKVSKVEHLKDVITMLREYVKVGDVEKKKFGEVMTDLNLVKHILSRIPKDDFSDPNKTFIDFSNGTGVFPLVIIYKLMSGLKDVIENDEARYKHIVENQIYVSEIQARNMFLYMCLVDPYDEYKLNVYTGSSLEEGFRNHVKNVWNKEQFDYGVGNPPFNQMIDMKFVRLSYELCDITCIVHPSTWLLDEKGKQKAFIETKELVKYHLESIELFNGNKVFGIQLFVPCVIIYINKNKKSIGIKCWDKINDIELTYDDIYQINKFSDIKIYTSLKNKIQILSKKQNLISNRSKIGEHSVNLSQIRGHVNLKSDNKMLLNDFYTIVTKDNVVTKDKKQQYYCFDDFNCAQNFLNYLKTNFSRFCLSIYKNNQNLHRGELAAIPWLDFSQEWTDEKLIQEFKLTGDEVNFINKNIPKYYD